MRTKRANWVRRNPKIIIPKRVGILENEMPRMRIGIPKEDTNGKYGKEEGRSKSAQLGNGGVDTYSFFRNPRRAGRVGVVGVGR